MPQVEVDPASIAALLGVSLLLARAIQRRRHDSATRDLPRARIVGPIAIRPHERPAHLPSTFLRAYVEAADVEDLHVAGSNDWSFLESAKPGKAPLTDRAVSANSTSHYEALAAYLNSIECNSGVLRGSTGHMVTRPIGGENILLSDGFNVESLCVGDLIEVRRSPTAAGQKSAGSSPLLQVSSPRRPCQSFDKMFGPGAQVHVMQQGLGGIFFTVLRQGSVHVGMSSSSFPGRIRSGPSSA